MNIVCASHDKSVLDKNLGDSLFYKYNHVKVVPGYNNISKAYNLENKKDDYNLFIHHDVYLPDDFGKNLNNSITQMNYLDSNFGVLGVAGAAIENGERKFYGHIKDRGRDWNYQPVPREVQTLDELLLITKGDFTFDEQFDLHFYGADISLQAIKKGKKNYVIDAYVHHNSTLRIGFRSQSFKENEERFKEKWKDVKQIVTTCSIIENI